MERRRRLLLACIALPLALAPLAPAAAQPADTIAISKQPLFTKRDAWLAVGFLATTAAMTGFDERFAQRLQDSSTQANDVFEWAANSTRTVTESAFIIGGTMYLAGRFTGNEKLADLGWHGTEALIVGTAAYGLGKGIFGRSRPEAVDAKDSRDFKFGRGFGGGPHASFPSGHTTTAFAAAAAVTAETHRWWPKSTWIIAPAMYGGATMMGLSRMYDNKHWASDVAMGALLGTFAGLKVVQYHHSHPSNKLDEWILGKGRIAMTPSGDAVAAVEFTFR